MYNTLISNLNDRTSISSSLEVLFFSINMSRQKLAWANKEVETFVCILGEEDVVYDVFFT